MLQILFLNLKLPKCVDSVEIRDPLRGGELGTCFIVSLKL